jgi:RNA polymerase sigma-70 factor (ECF subfamily)
MAESELSPSFFIRLNDGAESAATEVDTRYREKLCALVQQELSRRLAGRLDPEDIVQPALRSFFRGIDKKGWNIVSEEALWGLLVKITRSKIRKSVETHSADKRAFAREVPCGECVLVSREPAPEDAAIAADLVEETVRELDPPGPEIFRLRLEGHSMSQIALMTDQTAVRVRITLNRIRDRLRRLLSATAAE